MQRRLRQGKSVNAMRKVTRSVAALQHGASSGGARMTVLVYEKAELSYNEPTWKARSRRHGVLLKARFHE